MKAINLCAVTFSYDGKTNVLDNINFSAEYGEVALVAGHSGSGKSTLMSIVCGIIPNVIEGKLSGEVSIDGESIVGLRLGEICKKVGVVLQNADEQIIQKTVEDEIAFGCENLAFPAEKISRQVEIVCDMMKLNKFWQTRTLSGGQKQRLITASTLAMGQKIILLDEPLANLDKVGGAELMRTLRSLAAAGYCVVVIEHRLDMVLPFVDKVWHVGDGKVVEIAHKQSYLSEQTRVIPDSCAEFFGGSGGASKTSACEKGSGLGGSALDGSISDSSASESLVTEGSASGSSSAKSGSVAQDSASNRSTNGQAKSYDAILSLNKVSFFVAERQILKSVTFDVSKGERVLLLGENGCGKTTLMRLIARLSKPTGGTITQQIDVKLGQSTRGSRRWFKKVGVVYQNPDYQLFMPTVRQEIEFGAVSRDYAEEMGALFGLTALWNRHPQSLSEGQKRRVSIAAVCASKPEVLLLDEPTVGQDYDGLRSLVEILNKLHRETGNTMITVTHDVRCAEALCDHAVWIKDGVVFKRGGKELAAEYFASEAE